MRTSNQTMKTMRTHPNYSLQTHRNSNLAAASTASPSSVEKQTIAVKNPQSSSSPSLESSLLEGLRLVRRFFVDEDSGYDFGRVGPGTGRSDNVEGKNNGKDLGDLIGRRRLVGISVGDGDLIVRGEVMVTN
ncbi:hypothetical protein ACFX2I_015278 [Malus domestica]